MTKLPKILFLDTQRSFYFTSFAVVIPTDSTIVDEWRDLLHFVSGKIPRLLRQLADSLGMTGRAKLVYFLLSTFYFLLATFYLLPNKINAQEMSSQNFRLQGGNLNMTSGNKASQNFKLSDVVGQTASSLFNSKGFFIQSGFLNTAAAAVFSLSIYPAVVDFGTLSPNSPIEKTLQITISNGDIPGYSISVAEDHELSTLASATIPDTSCNRIDQPCNINKALRWDDAGIFGFGYNLAGNSVARDFTDKSFYRPFANLSQKESPAQIMISQQKKVIDQSVMTLKLNISSDQAVGQYRNTINFTAVAGI